MEIRRVKFVAGVPVSEEGQKRTKLDGYLSSSSFSWETDNGGGSSGGEKLSFCGDKGRKPDATKEISISISNEHLSSSTLTQIPVKSQSTVVPELLDKLPKFGMASVCGRRRNMEDSVAIHPFLCRQDRYENSDKLHYFGVYDGHGCSHVATKCKDRLHELVKEELEKREETTEWKDAMEKSFIRMDKEVVAWDETVSYCRCELQTPECDAVGSTAVVSILTEDKIVVANCGDSRAVLCRNGKAVPLSSDHKPDRPDELERIQSAGGRVIYWEGPRVLGVLAMSRAIGDNYLKPYVCCEPEVTITDRTAEDDCLILASDGLWDVVSNETACEVARMCLRGKPLPTAAALSSMNADAGGDSSDKACSDAAILLTKLALARHSSDNVSIVVVDLRKATQ